MPPIVNIAAYKFVTLDDLETLRQRLRSLCRRLELKGTILLSPEGINLFLSGTEEAINEFLTELDQDERFAELEVKRSSSDEQPFNRMLVRIKREIIAFGVDGIEPAHETSEKLSARDLRQWLDAGRELTLLDVRNDYEVELGTFEDAVPIGIDHFRDFPAAARALPEDLKAKPIVMFCTGGIRCEKAGPYMESLGFEQVFQLEGGILKYFEECGGTHYAGECFVFDQRVALDPQLHETDTAQCFACQAILSPSDQESPDYVLGKSCPYCIERLRAQHVDQLESRNVALAELADPLPGSRPYLNERPLNVPLRFDGLSLVDFLMQYHPHVGRSEWERVVHEGGIQYQGRPVGLEATVHAGQRLVHAIPDTIEPDVNPAITVLFEDESLIVIDKPAPLPVHACGRFNRNTVDYLMRQLYVPQQPRPAHRLDANTTGVMVFSRTRAVARALQPQFSEGDVHKTYLALVSGRPTDSTFDCAAPISSSPTDAGLRTVQPEGDPARTEFRVLAEFDEGRTLLEVVPRTGRTNQIRVHLWHLGLPICGDPAYLSGRQLGSQQTLAPHDPPLCLHAWKLSLDHPRSGVRLSFSAALPAWSRMSESQPGSVTRTV